MGSRQFSGSGIYQSDTRVRHIGELVQLTSMVEADTTQPSTDTSVEIEKYTVDGSTSGNLGWDYSRAMGIHNSISHVQCSGSTGSPSQTIYEKKDFFLDSDRGKSSGFAAWTIYDADGNAVGATDGTTNIDITPTGVSS